MWPKLPDMLLETQLTKYHNCWQLIQKSSGLQIEPMHVSPRSAFSSLSSVSHRQAVFLFPPSYQKCGLSGMKLAGSKYLDCLAWSWEEANTWTVSVCPSGPSWEHYPKRCFCKYQRHFGRCSSRKVSKIAVFNTEAFAEDPQTQTHLWSLAI